MRGYIHYTSRKPCSRRAILPTQVLGQPLLVPAQQQSVDPTAGGEVLFPLIVQVHCEHIAELAIEAAAFRARQPASPVPVARIWFERVREAVVEATGVGVGEAKGENLEWRDAFRHESTPET